MEANLSISITNTDQIFILNENAQSLLAENSNYFKSMTNFKKSQSRSNSPTESITSSHDKIQKTCPINWEYPHELAAIIESIINSKYTLENHVSKENIRNYFETAIFFQFDTCLSKIAGKFVCFLENHFNGNKIEQMTFCCEVLPSLKHIPRFQLQADQSDSDLCIDYVSFITFIINLLLQPEFQIDLSEKFYETFLTLNMDILVNLLSDNNFFVEDEYMVADLINEYLLQNSSAVMTEDLLKSIRFNSKTNCDNFKKILPENLLSKIYGDAELKKVFESEYEFDADAVESPLESIARPSTVGALVLVNLNTIKIFDFSKGSWKNLSKSMSLEDIYDRDSTSVSTNCKKENTCNPGELKPELSTKLPKKIRKFPKAAVHHNFYRLGNKFILDGGKDINTGEKILGRQIFDFENDEIYFEKWEDETIEEEIYNFRHKIVVEGELKSYKLSRPKTNYSRCLFWDVTTDAPKLFISGGICEETDQVLDEVEVYDFDSGTTEILSIDQNKVLKSARFDHSSVLLNDKIYLIAGDSSLQQNLLDSVEIFDLKTMKFQFLSENLSRKLSLNIPRKQASAIEFYGKILIIGGIDDTSGGWHSCHMEILVLDEQDNDDLVDFFRSYDGESAGFSDMEDVINTNDNNRIEEVISSASSIDSNDQNRPFSISDFPRTPLEIVTHQFSNNIDLNSSSSNDYPKWLSVCRDGEPILFPNMDLVSFHEFNKSILLK